VVIEKKLSDQSFFTVHLSIFIAFFGHKSSHIPHRLHEFQSTITGLLSWRLKTAIAQQSTHVYELQSLHLTNSILIFIESAPSSI